MTKKHVMLDLEFFGFYVGAPIIAIGAAGFTVEEGVTDVFSTPVNLQSCLDLGMKPDGDTICWWGMQSEEARRQIFVDNDKAPSLYCALQMFSDWFSQIGGCTVWGNGSDTDNAYLWNAYHLVGLKAPWDYRNNRCYRTMKNQYPDCSMPEWTGTHHSAVDDANNQARHLTAICHEKGISLK